MYNRYIPKPDGSYARRTVDNTAKPAMPQGSPSRQEPPVPEPDHGKPGSVPGFLRRLLPKEFDTGDLLILVLLLLMAGDSREEQNSALLTLALYFFM